MIPIELILSILMFSRTLHWIRLFRNDIIFYVIAIKFIFCTIYLNFYEFFDF